MTAGPSRNPIAWRAGPSECASVLSSRVIEIRRLGLAIGRIADVDKRLAERLRRGRLPIEGKLDLHGLTQGEAHDQLAGFIAVSQKRGHRCILVVTGKGLWREGAGILREMVPRWLNEAPNRARVLAIAHAQPRHGGTGALYLLLKRRREE